MFVTGLIVGIVVGIVVVFIFGKFAALRLSGIINEELGEQDK